MDLAFADDYDDDGFDLIDLGDGKDKGVRRRSSKGTRSMHLSAAVSHGVLPTSSSMRLVQEGQVQV